MDADNPRDPGEETGLEDIAASQENPAPQEEDPEDQGLLNCVM